MKNIIAALVSTCTLAFTSPTFAQFPCDLSDVVFIEGSATGDFVRGMAETANLNVTVGGGNVIMDSSKKNSWPAGSGSIGTTNLNCCNANAWVFVKVGNTWYGGTWEFLRVGQTTKKTSAMVGPNHLRFSPLQNFSPRNGEVYGYMVAGITRNSLSFNNIRERSNIALHRFGVGSATNEDIGVSQCGAEEASTPVLAPIIDLLNSD